MEEREAVEVPAADAGVLAVGAGVPAAAVGVPVDGREEEPAPIRGRANWWRKWWRSTGWLR